MSLEGSVPTLFRPSFSQKRPATVNHPSSAVSRASRLRRHSWISDEYVWPAASEIPYSDLTAEEKAALEKLYPGKVEDQYVEGTATGYYASWRLYIDEDGHWTSFVAGD